MHFAGIPLSRRLLTITLRHVAGLVVLIVGVRFLVYGILTPWSATLRQPMDWRQVALGVGLFVLGFTVLREAGK
jgi:hypothetical protein